MRGVILYFWMMTLLTLMSSGCSSTLYTLGGYGYSDDMYSVHDRATISRVQRAEQEAERAEAEARRAQYEALLAQVGEYNSGEESLSYTGVLADTYESAYARRLRGFDSPTYRMPSSYYELRYSPEFAYVTAYDPMSYNIIVMGDEVWVEPKYITSMFGTWGAPPISMTLGYSGWYSGYYNCYYGYNPYWYNPYWYGYGYPYYNPYYNPYYSPYWYGWYGWPGWGPMWSPYPPRPGGGHHPSHPHYPNYRPTGDGGYRGVPSEGRGSNRTPGGVRRSSPYTPPSYRGGSNREESGVRGERPSGDRGNSYTPSRGDNYRRNGNSDNYRRGSSGSEYRSSGGYRSSTPTGGAGGSRGSFGGGGGGGNYRGTRR